MAAQPRHRRNLPACASPLCRGACPVSVARRSSARARPGDGVRVRQYRLGQRLAPARQSAPGGQLSRRPPRPATGSTVAANSRATADHQALRPGAVRRRRVRGCPRRTPSISLPRVRGCHRRSPVRQVRRRQQNHRSNVSDVVDCGLAVGSPARSAATVAPQQFRRRTCRREPAARSTVSSRSSRCSSG